MEKKKLLLTNDGFFNANSEVTKAFFQMIGKEPQKIKVILASAYKFITEIDETAPICKYYIFPPQNEQTVLKSFKSLPVYFCGYIISFLL